MSKQTRAKGKFKSIFGRKPSGTDSGSVEEKDGLELVFSKEILLEISKPNSIIQRARALKEFGEVVLRKKLEDHAIEGLLNAINDLIDPSVQTEGRQAALQFLISLTSSQYERLGIVRSQLFRMILDHQVKEDLPLRVSLLKVLTDNGKDISYCEQIGGFLVDFMPEALYSLNADEFLMLLVNILHYNSSFLDKGIISALVLKTCKFCDQIDGDHDIEECLSLLDASVRYGGLSSEGIYPLIRTLCWTVNIEKFCQSSWKLMRNLIGTKLGHTAIYFMCQILEDNDNFTNITLIRGAVFFIGMCIWGSKRVTSLHYEPVHVLPSFKYCLQSADPLVAKEISLSLQRLVKKFGADQEIITWDVIMDIIEILLKHVDSAQMEQKNSLYSNVHSILTTVEQLYAENKFHGCTKRLFQILASCAKDRPVESVTTLLGYYQEMINPSNGDWLDVFQTVFEEYFCKETRTMIRVKVIHMVSAIFSLYRHKYEDDILTVSINSYFLDISNETDTEVRLVISQLLSDTLMQCSATNYPTILAIVESLISGISSRKGDEIEDMKDIEIAISGLIKAFKEKLFVTNNNYVVNIFTILFNHVNQHYIHNIKSAATGSIRKEIFSLLLCVRVNEKHCIGLINSNRLVKYSTHVIFKSIQHEELTGFSKVCLVDYDFQGAFDAILKCLKNELDWVVLECVLKNLECQLQNKNLFVYCQCNMNKLCSALCILVNDKMYLNKVQNCPPDMGISELRNLIFPILSVIATYKYLSRDRQFELVSCIEFGLNTHCAHTCVSCLSICILEMEQVMIRLLPSILVKLSQISATVQLAIPVLEFLSTLKEIPSLYSNFVEEQYMSIFAMALSYTDSYRYSPYIVTLAHQIIADWFTRCRLIYRKGFVTLIAKALKSSTMINENREKRDGIKESETNSEIKIFHEEMTQVCLDMMARYSFSSHIRPPRRTNIIESLLSKGTSQTWLAGNMLITITTCSNIPGHCSSCAVTIETPVVSGQGILEQGEMLNLNSHKKADVGKVNIDQKRLSENSFSNYDCMGKEEPEVEVAVTVGSDLLAINEEDGCPSTVDVQDKCDSAALLSKLTEMLANSDTDMRMFSPSESLLFSRQGSKSTNTCNNAGEDENGDNDDEDEESGDGDSDGEDDDKSYTVQESIHADFRDCHNFDIEGDAKCLGGHTECNFQDHVDGASEMLDKYKIEQPTHSGSLVEDNTAATITMREPVAESIGKPGENSMHTSHSFMPTKPSCKIAGSYNNCECSCIGWAEVYIRRPTGNVSWIMEIDNRKDDLSAFPDLTTYTSSLEYLELYQKLSCSMLKKDSSIMQSDKLTASSSNRLHRSRSTGSIVDTVDANLVSSPIPTSILRSPLRPFLFAKSLARVDIASSTSPINSDFKVSKHDGSPASHNKTFPGYAAGSSTETMNKNSINPNFIFLQLFYSTLDISENHPIALEQSEVIARAMKILDRIPSANTHKFGVLYARRGQYNSEPAILSNQFGSTRYADFVAGLGDVVNLTECHPIDVYTGGLDNRGTDGNFAYLWKDETTQVIFHIATLMPNKGKDTHCISKKLHIGNNFVTIIYDDTKHGYEFGTIKGQFNSAEVVIRPLEYKSNMVVVRYKDTLEGLNQQPKIVSDINLPILVRQLAIHTNMAVVTELAEKKLTNAFASNWLERLRQIKRIKTKSLAEMRHKDNSFKYDFTRFM